MKEACCQFGEGGRLVGIVTSPSEVPPRRTALVLLSAGLAPRCGPFGLYADLARRLSDDGLLTLRFDLGGIGDSLEHDTGDSLEERTKRDASAALDYLLERHDLDAVVLGGLCSGAEDSFRAAENDRRVAGVVLIDPFAYRTPGWYWRHAAYRARRRLLRALGVYRPLDRAAPPTPGATQGRLVDYEYMARDESRRVLCALLARGARVHFVYTGGARDTFNHARQLSAMFADVPFRGLVTLDHFPGLDHTQLLSEDRRSVVEAISQRLGWIVA
ncbi:MAG TPA: hypothetical protein VKU41_30000 [Polyangiaceae bacterium]|nr:hypothetical protein [Polyangiaceae bacterium]